MQGQAAQSETNIDMVRMALKAHPLTTPIHNTLPHLSKLSFNRIAYKDLAYYPYRMERSHQLKPADYPTVQDEKH